MTCEERRRKTKELWHWMFFWGWARVEVGLTDVGVWRSRLLGSGWHLSGVEGVIERRSLEGVLSDDASEVRRGIW